MDRICQYSTIIFAGNVTVLLIVAVATDYWEYRGFRNESIVHQLTHYNRTDLIFPPDTESYFVLRYIWDARMKKTKLPTNPGNFSQFQPPAYLHKYYYDYYYISNNTTANNETITKLVKARRKTQDVIIFFEQYGNLFRDCDSLEAGVRRRLGFTQERPERCFNFILTFRGNDFINTELPAVIHLERSAFVFAVICMLSMFCSLVSGVHGTLTRERQTVIFASFAALTSGISLTISIALFHGKCYLLRRREFMAGIDIPFKKIINDSRIHYYGWSFVLAWICVVLCFIGAWVWLHKAQDLQSRRTFSFRAKRRMRKHVYAYGYKDRDAMLSAQ